MIKNTDFKQIIGLLGKADNVLLFPHENIDGDGIGSCVALCLALRSKSKTAWVVTGEKPADYVGFLEMGCCTTDVNIIEKPDVCVAIDCSEDSRLGKRIDKYKSCGTKICIDHHEAKQGFGDYYYIDSDEAAASQLIYYLLKEMEGVEITPEIATAIFAGISTDTGNFRYPNTNPQSHRIAAELMESGIKHNDIIVRLYQSTDFREMKVKAKTLENMELIADGRAVVSCITLETQRECNAEYEHTESSIEALRDIKGIEIAACIKEKEPGIIKCSLRAKDTGNVASIANVFGGGGHIRAAGFTVNDMTVEEVKAALIIEMEKAFQN